MESYGRSDSLGGVFVVCDNWDRVLLLRPLKDGHGVGRERIYVFICKLTSINDRKVGLNRS